MKICGVITASSVGETAELCRTHSANLDLFELRLDYLAGHQLSGLRDMVGRLEKPVIATLRPRRHGGRYEGSEKDRLEILYGFARAGSAFVDLEDDVSADEFMPFADMQRLLLSYHNFESTPADLPDIAARLARQPAQMLKIATRVGSLEDLVCLQRVQAEWKRDPREKVLIGMDSPGVITRILAGRLDSAIHYASLPGIGQSAAGQLDLPTLLGRYRLRELDASTEAYAVLGWPLGHTLSPCIHNACFGALGMNRVYVPLPAASLNGLREVSEHYRLRGFSVTLPHKTAIIPFCDDLDESARRAGAVNTIGIRNGRWLGANTDMEGFLRPLRSRIRLKGLHTAIIGSGGAARGVCSALTGEGARTAIYSRNPETGQAIAGDFGAAWHPLQEFGKTAVDLVVQATSVGMSPHEHESPCEIGRLKTTNGTRPCLVFDLVYNPLKTKFLAAAAELGFQTIEGLEMLLAQAALQFQFWTGQEMPMDVASDAAVRGLETQAKANNRQ